jgi:PKHD-type hydroxylase
MTVAWPVAPAEPNVWNAWAYLTPDEHGDEAFTAEECDRILAHADTHPPRPGLVGADGQHDATVRTVDVVDVPPSPSAAWLYAKLLRIAEGVNAAWWRFELTQLANVEVLRYQPGGHYVEHVDWSNGNQTRKLSLVVMLSDGDDYEGGDLVIRPGPWTVFAPRQRGSVIVFPSWTLHGVTSVTTGVRRTATAWVQGPPYR